MKNIGSIILALLLMLSISCDSTKNLAKINQQEVMKNKAAINTFYNKALSVNTETRPTQALTGMFAEGYKSSSSTDSKGAEALMGQLEFFWKVVPDLKWAPQTITNDGDVYTVRSIASGTPNGDFMGVPTDGTKKFSIMTMDMHTMKDGKFMSTHHIEDWSTAMQQLKPKMDMPKKAEAMKIADAYMGAMGKGDMETMSNLMHDDMVWQNAGDSSIPWIRTGRWESKKVILEKFLPEFSKGFQTIKWQPVDAVADDETAGYFGQMIGLLTNSGEKTNEFTYALRVKVKDGKVILWNWFEDSVEVSRAYNAK